jgi:hypothetical protein
MAEASYPCPCCGYLVFDERPGSYDICPICRWEDDLSQLRFVHETGANNVTLIQAQANFARVGAKDSAFGTSARKPKPTDRRDESWRPFDPEIDVAEEQMDGKDYGLTYRAEPDAYYYWRK